MSLPVAERDPAALEVAPPASHASRLASHAELLDAWLAIPRHCPPRWRSALFGRKVDLVRSHLRPIGDPELLAHSYAREHFHVASIGQPLAALALLARDATEVAYALRWLELRNGRAAAPWQSLFPAREAE